MERKKQSKCSLWEFCYANKIFGTFGDEIKACGQKLVKFCAHTHAAQLVVEIMCKLIVRQRLETNSTNFSLSKFAYYVGDLLRGSQ